MSFKLSSTKQRSEPSSPEIGAQRSTISLAVNTESFDRNSVRANIARESIVNPQQSGVTGSARNNPISITQRHLEESITRGVSPIGAKRLQQIARIDQELADIETRAGSNNTGRRFRRLG